MKRGRGEKTAEEDDDGEEVKMHLLRSPERGRNGTESQAGGDQGDHSLRSGGPERGCDPERQQV